jgi:hypothetical protein
VRASCDCQNTTAMHWRLVAALSVAPRSLSTLQVPWVAERVHEPI